MRHGGGLACRRGFTLIELAASLGAVSMVMVGLASVMMVSVQALPTPTDQGSVAADVTAAFDLMRSEMATMRSVTLLTGKRIEFVVPDRTGDGVAETIIYKWGGLVGDALERRVNGGAWVDLLGSAELVEFSADVRVESTTTQLMNMPTAEYVASESEDLIVGGLVSSTEFISGLQAYQEISPVMGVDVSSWDFLGVEAFLLPPTSGWNFQVALDTPVLLLEVREVIGAGVLSPIALASKAVTRGDIGDFGGWVRVIAAGQVGLPPATRLALLVRGVDSAEVRLGWVGGWLSTKPTGGLIGEPMYTRTGVAGVWAVRTGTQGRFRMYAASRSVQSTTMGSVMRAGVVRVGIKADAVNGERELAVRLAWPVRVTR